MPWNMQGAHYWLVFVLCKPLWLGCWGEGAHTHARVCVCDAQEYSNPHYSLRYHTSPVYGSVPLQQCACGCVGGWVGTGRGGCTPAYASIRLWTLHNRLKGVGLVAHTPTSGHFEACRKCLMHEKGHHTQLHPHLSLEMSLM